MRERLIGWMIPGKVYSSKQVIDRVGVGSVSNRVRLFQEAKALGYIQEVNKPQEAGNTNLTFYRLNQ